MNYIYTKDSSGKDIAALNPAQGDEGDIVNFILQDARLQMIVGATYSQIRHTEPQLGACRPQHGLRRVQIVKQPRGQPAVVIILHLQCPSQAFTSVI